jgi:hypothetical protein
VAGDPDEPGAERRLATKPREAVQGGKKHLLDDIVDEIGARCQAMPRIGVDGIGVRSDKTSRRFPVLAENRRDQFEFVPRRLPSVERLSLADQRRVSEGPSL